MIAEFAIVEFENQILGQWDQTLKHKAIGRKRSYCGAQNGSLASLWAAVNCEDCLSKLSKDQAEQKLAESQAKEIIEFRDRLFGG